MINANELRLGNKIYCRDNIIDVTLFTLHSIKYEGNEECYSPIPLTEEWLLKFGATRTHDKDWFLINGITLGYITKDDVYQIEIRTGFDKGFVIDVPYVHYIQNIVFALTGKELTCTD